MKKILVCGAGGFIGGHLVSHLIKHENLKAQVTVCEQLAYSAYLDDKGWRPAVCPTNLQEQRRASFGDSLFNINGEQIDYSTWAEGNRKCPTSVGDVERFPDPRFTMKSASLVITPYADNRRKSYLKQFHILKIWDLGNSRF